MNPKDIAKLATWDEKKQEWRCKKCDSVIMGKEVVHSLWLPGMVGGFGETTRETIPYCPKCEKEPSEFGAPIDYGSEDDPETEELRRIKRIGEKL